MFSERQNVTNPKLEPQPQTHCRLLGKAAVELAKTNNDNEDDEAHKHVSYFNPYPGFSAAAGYTVMVWRP